jgi:hypothetical protein
MPKVHNKPIKKTKKGFKQREQKTTQRHPSLAHRTVFGAPPDSVRCTRELDAKLLTFGKMGGHSAIIHQTVRCASRATATSHATVDCNAFNARLRAQRTEHAQKAHQTVYRTCPVHHRTAQKPHLSELQRSEPNGRLTWLAHRTIRCAMRQTASQRPLLVVGAINTPTTPHSIGIQVFQLPTPYKSYSIQYKTLQRDQILSQVQRQLQSIVTSERVIFVFI